MKNSNGILKLHYGVYIQMLHELKRCFPKETGGILMGTAESTTIINHYIGPGPKAIHENFSFTPDDEYQKSAISEIYSQTSGDISYLGDWHTHPKSHAYLSRLDKEVIKKIATYKPARLPKPLMLIIGTSPFEIAAWKYDNKVYSSGKTFRKIEITLFI